MFFSLHTASQNIPPFRRLHFWKIAALLGPKFPQTQKQTNVIAALATMAQKRKRDAVQAPVIGIVDGHEARLGSPGDEDGVSITSSSSSEAYEPPEQEDEDGFAPAGIEGGGGCNGGKKASVPRKKKASKSVAKKTPEEDTPRVRPPAFNSSYVPLPFKGRIGYACLNTYLRTSFPPIFCSRTCRIDTILKQGPWATSGIEFVQSLGLQNARDLSKMIEWNEKYQIRFLRVSSEMFPFASHAKYGYDLDFAYPVLQEAGKLAMKYGHRLTTHPGQFTQLGSPRPEVIKASVKDLEYHSQLLRGLGLEGQADRDAVMILHMGGMFGDKAATLDRFRKNYTTLLSEDVKQRLVLENDDVTWSVHDLLPICQELNIPLVLDYHHHNIIHDPSMREGTEDIMSLFPDIKATWTCKGITQKQHYSEPCEGAFTGREMRKHSPRVAALPPCDDTMDLMIEAKDKEQAVFELYRKYGIGGQDVFREVIPHERADDNRPKGKRKEGEQNEARSAAVPDDEIGMGGAERRVYWPEGKEDWLSPRKRVTKKKAQPEDQQQKEIATKKPPPPLPPPRQRKKVGKVKEAILEKDEEDDDDGGEEKEVKLSTVKPRRSKKTVAKAPKTSSSTLASTPTKRSLSLRSARFHLQSSSLSSSPNEEIIATEEVLVEEERSI
ncbi:UV-endonuclease UvdE-domain-containing protein [Sphaerosporella brunnea]|uniref:UV-endonuclease UvdE-domain-containing protein n=1 Tax=Sphaerosporella brunnea TaxID=1250544 RepID=A0A5J5ELI0_9PEZI|nr:UV-endonuclease UvdE-domain-containing protein [Sphaerosporella brunnea]